MRVVGAAQGGECHRCVQQSKQVYSGQSLPKQPQGRYGRTSLSLRSSASAPGDFHLVTDRGFDHPRTKECACVRPVSSELIPTTRNVLVHDRRLMNAYY